MHFRYEFSALLTLTGLLVTAACSSTDSQASASSAAGGASGNSAGLGGNASTGGAAALGSGGSKSTGGAAALGSGGSKSTGGAVALGSGGSKSTGGAAALGSGGSKSTGGAATLGSGGSKSTGGAAALGSGGSKSTGGAAALGSGGSKSTGGASSTLAGASTGGNSSTSSLGLFSFFVASQQAMVRLSNSGNGFGGDLRYGMADGLSGADKICTEIAESSMPGSGAKGWRAFLSVTAGPMGTPVNAIDRVGTGPWYDRVGHLVAANKTDLLNPRPVGANAAIINDLPNESGTPNHATSGAQVDNHDTLTGTDSSGGIGTTTRANTCNDWTSAVGSTGKPQTGHSWPRGVNNAVNWYSEHTAPGCAAGINTGTQNGSGSCVGCSGGYGGIYCFALVP